MATNSVEAWNDKFSAATKYGHTLRKLATQGAAVRARSATGGGMVMVFTIMHLCHCDRAPFFSDVGACGQAGR